MSGGGLLGNAIGLNSGSLRLGILATPEFSAALSSDQAMSMIAEGASNVSFDGRTSHPMDMVAESISIPVSDLFATEGVFTSPTELFWGTIWTGGAEPSEPLINNYQHSETPVKYIRLDDITLEYTANKLTRVLKEEGDDKILEYTGNNLTRVTDNYHGIIKDLSYSGNQLTSVVVSKII